MRLKLCLGMHLAVALACLAALPTSAAKADDIDLLLGGPSRFLPRLQLTSDDEPNDDQPAKRIVSTGMLPDIDQVLDGDLRVANQAPRPAQPLQPAQPLTPQLPPPAPSNQNEPPTPAVQPDILEALKQNLGASFAEGITPASAPAASSSDVGQLLSSAQGAESVSAQHRSEVAYDPVIRGYSGGQIYASGDGAYWYAARPDLDTMLSKFEPALIQSIAVIPGPYGVQYGPGLSFIDVQTIPTIRSESGCFESDYKSLALYRFNGAAGSVREIVDGGSGDWGFRLSYGLSKGSDYEAGNGMHIPSAYDNRDVLAQFGYDLGCSTHLEVAYQRFDQQETQYPGRLFNIDHMGTDAFNIRLTNDDAGTELTKWSATGWYNRTDFHGTIAHNPNYGPGVSQSVLQDPNQFWTVERIEAATDIEQGHPIGSSRLDGTTAGNNLSTGYRFGTQFGDTDDTHLNIGTDFRYLQQNIVEDFVGTNPDFPLDALGAFNDKLPTSYLWDPGVYAQWTVPWTSYFKTELGVRYDFVSTNARASEIQDNPPAFTNGLPPGPLDQGNSLFGAYITNEIKLDKCFTARLGLGHADNPPTLLERYSDGEFVGLAQDGFTKLFGNPGLSPERNTQVDASIEANYDCWRGKASAYYAWINDYITYQDNFVSNQLVNGFPTFRTYEFINARLATLTGFELTGEYDLNCRWSTFGKMAYVYGVNEQLHASLPDIPPLDTNFGVRWHDPCKDRKWQVEFFGRADYKQTHLGYITSTEFANQPPPFGGLEPTSQRTPGFLIWNIHAYYYYNDNLKFVAGIDNIFNRTYLQALDLRLVGPASQGGPPVFPTSFVYEPGFSPYFGLEWKY